MSRHRGWIAGTAVALVTLLLLAWMLRPRPVEAWVARATRGPLEVVLFEEGETRVRDRYVISAPVAGRLSRVVLDAGDPVRRDETVLATFEPSAPVPLDSRARAEAEADLRAAAATLEQRSAERDRLTAELSFAQSELERYSRLAADEVVSAERFEQVELEAERARRLLDAAVHAVTSATSRVEGARARLGLATRTGRGGAIELRSPVDGVVLRRLRESEAVVAAGEPLLEVGDPDDLEIVADFLSSEAVRIQPGQPARLEDWGGDGPLAGTVRRVEPSAFLKISALGVEEQRVNVIVDLTDPPEARRGLADGFRLQTGVVVWEGDDVLSVPVGALVRQNDRWTVFAVEDGRARQREVTLGRRNEDRAAVAEGLEPGATVIVYPGEAVADGVRLRTLAE